MLDEKYIILRIASASRRKDVLGRSLISQTADAPPPLVVDSEVCLLYTSVAEGGDTSLDLVTIEQQLRHSARIFDFDQKQTLAALSLAFLTQFKIQSVRKWGSGNKLARINPLVLVLAGGGDNSRDISLELSACYWAGYAAGFSDAKPGAIIATLVHQSSLNELIRRQKAVRLALRSLPFYHNDLRLLDLRIKRQAIGQALLALIEPAACRVLLAAYADRIIACSTVALDFLPFGGTILGLERPLSRLPLGHHAGEVLTGLHSAAYSGLSEMIGTGGAFVCVPIIQRDESEHWAFSLGSRLTTTLPVFGFQSAMPSETAATPSDVMPLIATAELVIFVAHSTIEADGFLMDLGTFSLSPEDLCAIEWTGKVVLLIGCETAAEDLAKNDLSRRLLHRGARAIIGTSCQVSIDSAEIFLATFFRNANQGLPIDYSFFLARQVAVVGEALVAKGMTWAEATSAAIMACQTDPWGGFLACLTAAGLTWPFTYTHASYGLSWTLTGGATERLR